MKKFIMGFDDNLGLPQDFVNEMGLEKKSYHNLAEMLQDFKNDQLSLIFLPAGALPYVEEDYNLVAQASFGEKRANFLTSKLVTAKNLTISDVAKSQLGRVNQYCTTSFWAPLIYFMKQLKQITSLKFINTDGFQDLLFKVADEKITCGMVWDIILENNPEAASKVHVLGVESDLPAPVIITKQNIPATLKEKITHFKSQDKKSFFNGFTAVNVNLINNFREQVILTSKHFNLKPFRSSSF